MINKLNLKWYHIGLIIIFSVLILSELAYILGKYLS